MSLGSQPILLIDFFLVAITISEVFTLKKAKTILMLILIREYGSTLYVGLSRFPHRANTNYFRYNSIAGNHFLTKI